MRIGIDVDDVVADLHTPWLARYSHATGTQWTPEDMTQWDFENDLGCSPEVLRSFLTPDIYDHVKPVPGALEAIAALGDQGHFIIYVTSCGDEAMFDAKYQWLERHGFLPDSKPWFAVGVGPWSQYKTKAEAIEYFDIGLLVDDSVDNVEAAPCLAYLMTRPHNRRAITPRKRVKSLYEVVSLLKYRKSDVIECAQEVVAEATKPLTLADVSARHQELVGKMQAELAAEAKGALPTDWQARKDTPIVRGLLDYFPNACAAVAQISAAGNKQHFTPGTPLHWDFAKSSDHADSCVRHMVDRGTIDTDGTRHTAKAAWRALAELETELIAAGATPGRAVKMPEAS